MFFINFWNDVNYGLITSSSFFFCLKISVKHCKQFYFCDLIHFMKQNIQNKVKKKK